ncbi:MAG: hypothetical protein MRY32_08365 [Rickettsiales bacterium]|nr:hypothetical protein [Rickettsiales bacterium]
MAEEQGGALAGIAKIGKVVLAVAAVIGIAAAAGYGVESLGGERIYGQLGGGIGASLLDIPNQIVSWLSSFTGGEVGTTDGLPGIEQVGEAAKIDPEVINSLNEQANTLGGTDGVLTANVKELGEFVTELEKLKGTNPDLYAKIVDSFDSHGFSIDKLKAAADSLATVENVDFKNMTGKELTDYIKNANYLHDSIEAFNSSEGYISQAIDDKAKEVKLAIDGLDVDSKDFAADKAAELKKLTDFKAGFEPFQTATTEARDAITTAKNGLLELRNAQHAVLNPSINPYAATAAVAAGGATAYGIAKMGSHAEREEARREMPQDNQVYV